MTRVYRVGVCAAVAMLQVTLAFGQATTATVRGLVQDGQGRPVPTATVTVRAPDTSLTRTVPVAEDGTYVVAGLPPSTVEVSVSAGGFADSRTSGLVLEVGQSGVLHTLE